MSNLVTTASQILSESVMPPQVDLDHVTNAAASARANQMFPSFKSDSLTPFNSNLLDSFRAYIHGMGRVVNFSGNVIGYPVPRSLRGNHGHAMRNEADVRTFANSIYVGPAKAVILEMLPDTPDRTYDWVIRSEAMPPPSHSVGIHSIPDVGLAKCVRHASHMHGLVYHDQPVVLIEFKSPSVVFFARNSAERHCDESPDWKAMTKQLRKYAVLWNCRRLDLMDERLAFFFYFPAADLMDPNQPIHYLSAESSSTVDVTSSTALPPGVPAPVTRIPPTAARYQISIGGGPPKPLSFFDLLDPGPSQGFSYLPKSTPSIAPPVRTAPGSSATFTIRELPAFAAWHALGDEPGLNQRKNYEQVRMEVQPCAYIPLILPHNVTDTGNNATDDKGKRRAPTCRTRKQTVFFPAIENTKIILTRCEGIEMTPDDYRFDDPSVYHTKYSEIYLDLCRRCSETNAKSGYHSDTNPHRSTSTSATCHHDAKNTLSLQISRDNLLSGLPILYLDRVRPITSRVSTAHLTTSPTPAFPDITIIVKRFDRRNYLFREQLAYAHLHHLQSAQIPGCFGVFARPGDSALYLVLEHIDADPVAAGVWSESVVRGLLPEARTALRAVHEAGVYHGDVAARNVLLDPEDQRGVVLVDWELCVVGGGEEGTAEDCIALEWVFGKGLGE